MKKQKLSIIVPCYNEEEGISYLVAELDPMVEKLQQNYEVELIFVDDASKHHTNHLLKAHYGQRKNVKIIKHEHNQNLGAALKTGFSQATGDLIACLDSDCTYPPRLLEQLAGMIDEHTDISTVSPYHPRGKINHVPAHRLFLSKSVSRLYRTLLRSPIYTYTAMVRVYKKEVIQKVPFQYNTFLGVTELMVKSILKGYKVKELPAELSPRKFGTSKIKTFRLIRDHLGLIVKIAAHKIVNKERP